jgi:mRNA interferase RelE/StbE
MTEPTFYRVEFDPRAWDEITALPERVQQRIFDATDALETNPRPSGVVKLAGSDDLYRVRVGDYRIIYQVQDARLVVVVVKVGNRREVYRRR